MEEKRLLIGDRLRREMHRVRWLRWVVMVLGGVLVIGGVGFETLLPKTVGALLVVLGVVVIIFALDKNP